MRGVLPILLAVAACGSAAPRPAPATAPSRPEPAAFLRGEDPVAVVGALVRLARAGDAAALEATVDWEFWRRLIAAQTAPDSVAAPGVESLVGTLQTVPEDCEVKWDVSDEGGLRFDFPPVGVMELSPEEERENEAVHAELYQGHELTAWCERDGEREEHVIVLLLRRDGVWRVRAWGMVPPDEGMRH